MRACWTLSLSCLVLACGGRPGARPAAVGVSSPDDACFGGTPEVVVEGVMKGAPFLIGMESEVGLSLAAGNLYWQAGMGPMSVSLATRKPTQVNLGDELLFRTADEREMFGVPVWSDRAADFDLVAVDIKTGKRRTVMAGREGHWGLTAGDQVVLDGDYAYFTRTPWHGKAAPEYGFFRMRRDGTGQPQRMGDQPTGSRMPFLIENGYVYWNSDGKDGPPALWRRALAPNSPAQRLASTNNQQLPMVIDHGRLFFVDAEGIASVPVDGSAPSTLHVPGTVPGRTSLVADRACVYWTSERGIYRSRLTGTGTPELIADDTNYRGGAMTTDGQRLYWMDRRRDRIVSLGRGAGSLPEPSVLVAKVIDAKRLNPDIATPQSRLLVGDGWGCAKVFGWNQPHWQCWNNGGKPGTPPKARLVTGLSPEASPAVGADRLCFLDGNQGRCWSWPELAQGKPADRLETQVRQGRLGQWLEGGSFSCLLQYVGAERMLACTGDDSYGQLAQKEQPIALERWQGALGTWHGCVSGSNITRDLMCWGRGDAGQLGRAPGETCTVGGRPIPCDRNLRKTDFTLPGLESLQAGDMFTCAILGNPREVRCWGGSRDGWFGDAPCSPELRQSWPVGTSAVPAPKATCSTVAVRILEPGSEIQDVSIGPRGVCLMEDGHPRCLGALATPTAPVGQMAVSKGSQANACGIDGERVLCWGEGYSPAGQPGSPVPITFAATVPASAVVDFPPPAGTSWSADHLINNGCEHVPITLPVCDAQAKGEPWASLLPKVDSLTKQRVSVRDRLVVGPLGDLSLTDSSCGFARNSRAESRGQRGKPALPGTNPLGCYRDQRSIVLGTAASPLRLWGKGWENYQCVGDESRLCCGAPAFGQTVVATGVLDGNAQHGWALRDVTLCELAPH